VKMDPETELRELRSRLADAEHAAESRARVVGHVAHEFRTPLSSILGFASLLADEDDLTGERRDEYLGIILRNARHLLHVVNDILNLSKVEAGALEVTLGAVSAGEVAEAVADSLRTVAGERAITLRLTDDAPRMVRADAGRLRQVLLNLMDNAIKYSPRGSAVEVAVRGDDREVCVEVTDHGPGVSDDDQTRLFKEFSRIRHAGARVAGAGLGLALAKALVEAMGGEIGVRSRPGSGSTFWLSLPAAEERTDEHRAHSAAAAIAEPQRSGVVAVVDDDGDIRAYVAAVLNSAGYTAVSDDGAERVCERIRDARPEVVLLDLNLEHRSGIEVLGEIRRDAALAGAQVLAFTASASEADQRRTRDAGFDGHIAKPVEPGALLLRVDAEIARARSAKQAPAPVEDEEEDFWAPLRARFRAGLPTRLAELEASLAAGDREAVTRHFHKLRGASAGYGFEEMASLAGAAEDAVRGGEALTSPAIGRAADHLRREIAEPSRV